MKNGIKVAMAIVAGAFTINVAKAQSVSDKDLKKNIEPVTNSVSTIAKLEPLSYEFDNSKDTRLNLPAGRNYGFIAEDVKQVVPEVVRTSNKWITVGKNNQRAITTTTVDLQELVPLLVGAVKEQQAQIEKLKQEVETLKAKVK